MVPGEERVGVAKSLNRMRETDRSMLVGRMCGGRNKIDKLMFVVL